MGNTKRFKIITWFIIAIMLLESIVSNGIIVSRAVALDDTVVATKSESDDQSIPEVEGNEKIEDNSENTQEEISEEQEETDNQEQEETDNQEQEEKIAPQDSSNEVPVTQVESGNSAPAPHNLTRSGQFALNDALNSVGMYVGGTVSKDTPWKLNTGTIYSAELSFSESTGNSLPKDDTDMVYTLPSNISMVSGSTGTFRMAFGNIIVPGTYRVEGQNVIFTWDTEDENFQYLQTASNAQFIFDLDFTYNGNGEDIEFSNDIKVPVIVNNDYNITGSKSAGDFCSSLNNCWTYDKTVCNLSGDDYNNIISYSVTVESDGLATAGTVLNDTLSSCMTLCSESFYVKHTTKNARGESTTEIIPLSSTDLTYQINTTDFSITFPQLKAEEKYEICYFATSDLNILSETAVIENNNLVTDGITNNMVITPPDNKESVTKSTTSKVYLSSIDKEGSSISYDNGDLDENMNGELSWKITSNEQHLISMAGETITDTMGTNADKMKYSGEGITVKVKDKNSQVVDTINVNWVTLGVDENSDSWSWTIPDSYKEAEGTDNFYSYEISYTTTIDASGMTHDFQVTNNVSSGNGESTAQSNIGVAAFELGKRVVSTTNSSVKWAIDVSVPGRGVSPLEIKDRLPNLNNYIDKLQSITVDGAEGYDIKYYADTWEYYDWYIEQGKTDGKPGDGWSGSWTSTEVANKEDATSFEIIFWYLDGNEEKQYGVPASADGKPINITIFVNTSVNEDWHNHSAETGTDLVHTNNVEGKAGEDTKTAEASVTLMKKSIEKTGEPVNIGYGNSWDSDYYAVPGFKYKIKLNGVATDSLTITDEFDTDWLKYIKDNIREHHDEWGSWTTGGDMSAKIYGKDNEWDQNDGVDVVVEETANGIIITADSIPMNGSNYYKYYYIEYTLAIREDKLDELNCMSVNDVKQKHVKK